MTDNSQSLENEEGLLVLIRHGLSEYNEKGLWTGLKDPPLTEKGREDAKEAGKTLSDIKISRIYTSPLKRSAQTLDEIIQVANLENIPVVKAKEIIERDYGIYTGKNKWEVKEQVGEEEFLRIRRGYDTPIPEGESSKQVVDRVATFYKKELLPKISKGENILLVGHGNVFRALAVEIESLTPEEFSKLEVGIGEVIIYFIDTSTGKMKKKLIRAEKKEKGTI